jgi:3-isopropylmalate/(R)-2-methylmalate dehydratase small subunit
MPNVDTDIITPMKRMLGDPTGMVKFAFEPYKFVGGDGDAGKLNQEFPLNQPKYKDAKIMLVGENFGGGSSRETAPAAIAGLGIRVLIGSSFGGIFFKNCFQQGILPITLPAEKLRRLAEEAEDGGQFRVDLDHTLLITPSGLQFPFLVEPLRRTALMNGLDDVGMTLRHWEQIEAFFSADRQARPWVYVQ